MTNGRKLFLTGLHKEDKTHVLLSPLEAYRQKLGGFYVQRHIKENRFCVCHTICGIEEGSLDAEIPFAGTPAHAFLTMHGNRNWFAVDVFDGYGTQIIYRSIGKPLVLLDDIGGIDLMSDSFFHALLELFDSGTPCVGTLKSEQALHRMRYAIKGADQCKGKRDELIVRLINSKNTAFLDSSVQDAESAIKSMIYGALFKSQWESFRRNPGQSQIGLESGVY